MKIGDTVKVVANPTNNLIVNNTMGLIGKIEIISKGVCPIKVNLNNGDNFYYERNELEVINHPNFEDYCKSKNINTELLNKNGIWLVYGDDQSGSYFGSFTPLLGVVNGTLADAINKALYKNGTEVNGKKFMFSYWASNRWGNIKEAEIL